MQVDLQEEGGTGCEFGGLVSQIHQSRRVDSETDVDADCVTPLTQRSRRLRGHQNLDSCTRQSDIQEECTILSFSATPLQVD